MDWFLFAAGVLSILVGIVHSALGEIKIFSKLRQAKASDETVAIRYLGILWATWHLASVLGWVMAAILIWAALARVTGFAPLQILIALGMAIGAVLVFVATKARHLGWVGLLGVSLLLVAGLMF